MSPNNPSRLAHNPQSGNAFFMVMVGVILFAALMFVFSRGARQGGNNLSKKQAEIAATDIMGYAQQLERGVNRLLQNGCSENDISFYLLAVADLADYKHTPAAPDRCKVFHGEGGRVRWEKPQGGVNDGSDWLFLGNNQVLGIGTTNSGGPTSRTVDLIALLPNLSRTVCEALNTELHGDPAIPKDDSNIDMTNLYAGGFGATEWINDNSTGGMVDGKSAYCVEGGGTPAPGTYHFYQVLIAR